MKKKSKKGLIIAIVIIVAVFAAAGVILSKMLSAGKGNAEIEDKTIAKVEKSNIDAKIFGRGVLLPNNQYIVKSLVKGEVLSSHYKEGDSIHKGDMLFEISQEDVKGQVTNAKIGIKRNENNLNNLKTQVSELNIKASIAGTITKLDVKKGDNVNAGQVIGEIVSNHAVKMSAYFISEDLKGIKNGSGATIIIDTTGEEIRARISYISPKEEMIDGGISARLVKLTAKGDFSSIQGAVANAKINSVLSIKGGAVEAMDTASIVAKASGQINSLNKEKGDTVSKGSVIANVVSKDLDRQIENAKLDIEQAKTALDDVKGRQKSYKITAPIDGTIVTLNKKAGDIVDPSVDTAGMAVIYDLSSMKLTLNVDELDILNIKKGQEVEIEAVAMPGETYKAVVENVSVQGTASNGVTSYPVVIKLLDVGRLMPSMNVTGNIKIGEVKDALTVPSSCLQRGNKLFVKDKSGEDNKSGTSDKGVNTTTEPDKNSVSAVPQGFHEVTVTVGLNDGERVEIKSGVSLGDEVYKPEEVVDNNTDFGF